MAGRIVARKWGGGKRREIESEKEKRKGRGNLSNHPFRRLKSNQKKKLGKKERYPISPG